MEVSESTEPKYYSEENSEFERIVKLIQSSRTDAAELIFEGLKKSIIKRKGRWMHEDRIWPHQNAKLDKSDKSKKKLKIVDNQELYTRFVPAANHSDENKPPAVKENPKEIKRDKFDEVFNLPTNTLSQDESEKTEVNNKRLTISNRNEVKKDDKEPCSKKIKTESVKSSKDEPNSKPEKSKTNGEEATNGKNDKSPASSLVIDDDVELLLSLSNGDQDVAEPKMLRKRKEKEVKKENPTVHRISNSGIHKKKNPSVHSHAKSSSKGNEPLFNLKENMKNHENDSLDPGKMRQKMFYGSTQVTRRDKPRREGTLADDSKKRLEAKLKKVKAKLKKST